MALSASRIPDVSKMALDFAFEYCNVKIRTKGTVDSAGEAPWTWTALDSNVKADIQPMSENELRRTAAGTERDATHKAFFESTVTFPSSWDDEDEEAVLRIETDSSGDGTADTYFRIVGVDDFGSHIEVLAKKVPEDA